MVLPSIVFSYFQFPNATTTVFLTRLPLMLTYTWFNLLAFTIDNQCHPGAVSEDALNKPWRPIPAKRITRILAVSLGAATIPVVKHSGWSTRQIRIAEYKKAPLYMEY